MKDNIVSIDSRLVNEKNVANFLSKNPSFFLSQRELLKEMILPDDLQSDSGSLADQIDRLIQEKKATQTKIDQMFEAARKNEQIDQLIHTLALQLVMSQTEDNCILIIENMLTETFGFSDASIVLYTDSNEITRRVVTTDSLSKVVFLELPDVAASLSDGAGASLLLQHEGQALGELVLAHADKNYFDESRDVLFLGQIAELIGCKLVQFHLAKIQQADA